MSYLSVPSQFELGSQTCFGGSGGGRHAAHPAQCQTTLRAEGEPILQLSSREACK